MTSDDAFMALAGVRYCLGRHGYEPRTCCVWLEDRWPAFIDPDRQHIVGEIRRHIAEVERERGTETSEDVDLRRWRAFVSWVETATQGGDNGLR